MKEITDKNIDIEFTNAVIDFYSPSCGPCKKMMPTLSELSEEIKDVTFYKINAVENPEFVKRFGVQGLPTIIVMNGGIVEDKFVGLVSKSLLKLAIGE